MTLQRTIGNQAVVNLLSTRSTSQAKAPENLAGGHTLGNATGNTKSQSKPTQHLARGTQEPVVQRAGFFDYLNKKRLPATITDSDKEEIAVAWLLDQNIHDLVDLLSGNVTEPVLFEAAKLKKHNVSTDDVVSYLRTKGAPSADASPSEHMAFLNGFMKTGPETLTQRIDGSIHAKTGKNASVIKWHGLTSWGAGTGVTLTMRPGGLVEGSTPKGSPVWMKRLEQHVPPNGNTTIYVQGHLLNHNIGGPGLDYNMVPLTGKPAKNVGGNDANADHLNLIEKAAKNTWDMVKGGTYQEAVYEVIPDYSRTTRPGTTQIRGEAEKLKEIRQAWIKNRMELIGKLSESDLAQFYVHTLRSFGITPTPVLPTKEKVIQELANKLSSDDLTKTFGVLKGQKHPVAEVIDKHIDSGILKASALGKLDTYSINDLLYLLDENAHVWEAEDIYVPAQLKVSLQWTDNKNKAQQHATTAVPVTLPSSPSAVGFRPKKKAEDA